MKLTHEPPPTVDLPEDPYLPVHPEPPDHHSSAILDQLLPNIGLASDADLAAAYFASQVACNTAIDVPISDFLKAKYLLSSKSSTLDPKTSKTSNPIASYIGSTSFLLLFLKTKYNSQTSKTC